MDHDSRPPGDRRRYDSPKREEQARATKARIAAAARRVFGEHGWARTRVRDVAAAAGTSEATVYAAYGSKAGLARALVDAIEDAAGIPAGTDGLDTVPDPALQLRELVASDVRLFTTGGDVIALLRDGGRTDPDLLDAYREGRSHGDALRRAIFASWPPGTLRDGITVDVAVDGYAALCTIDVYRELAHERGWTPDHITDWWTTSLQHTLLRRPRDDDRRRS